MSGISEDTGGKTKVEVGLNDRGADFIDAFNDSFINPIDSFSAVNEMQMDNNGNITMNGEDVDIRTEQEYKIDELVSEGMNRILAYAEVKLESVYEAIKEEIKGYIDDIKAELDAGKSPLEAFVQVHVIDSFIDVMKIEDIKEDMMGNAEKGIEPMTFGEALVKEFVTDYFVNSIDQINDIKEELLLLGEQLELAIIEEIEKYLDTVYE